MKHHHEYQITLIGPEEDSRSKNPNAKKKKMREIHIKNLSTGKSTRTFIVKGFANYDNWRSIIDMQDEAKQVVWHFESTMKRWVPSKQIYEAPVFELNVRGHIDADSVPIPSGKTIDEWVEENTKNRIIQDQLDTTFGDLFDATDVVKIANGWVIERSVK
jgi:hypothetical protein